MVQNKLTKQLETFTHNQDIKNAINYISGKGSNFKHEIVIFYNALGLNKDNVTAGNDIIKMQKKKGKSNDKRRGYHMIISFPEEITDTDLVIYIAKLITKKIYNNGYQVYYGIHSSTDNLHIHIFINAISYYINGKKFHFNNQYTYDLSHWLTEEVIERITCY